MHDRAPCRLLSNAVTFTLSGGRIALSAAAGRASD